MAKAVVCADLFKWGSDRPPTTTNGNPIIAETHVPGFTIRPDLRVAERGAFAALSAPRVIDHLVKLGINTIELNQHRAGSACP